MGKGTLAAMGRSLASSTGQAGPGAALVVTGSVDPALTTNLDKLIGYFNRLATSADIKELDTLGRRIHNLNQDLNGFAIASGVGFAAFTAGGIKAADQMKVFTAQFTGITGSAAGANATLQKMIALSTQLKLPLSQILGSAGQVAANLKLSGQDVNRLDEAVGLIQRMALLKVPGSGGPAGPQSAAIALTEAMQGQYRSLQTRLGISSTLYREFLAQANGDKLKALDMLMNKLGFTTEIAAKANMTFANSAQRLQESLGLLASTTLQPLLDEQIIPLIDNMVTFNQEFALSSPHIARLTTSLGLLALAMPVVIRGGLGMIETFTRLRAVLLDISKTAGIGGGVGKLLNSIFSLPALGGLLAAGGGAVLGGALAQPISQAVVGGKQGDVKEVAPGIIAQNVSGISADETLARITQFFKVMIALVPQVSKVFVDFGNVLSLIMLKVIQSTGKIIEWAGKTLANIPGLEDFGKKVEGVGKSMQKTASEGAAELIKRSDNVKASLDNATLALYGIEKASGNATDGLNQTYDALDKFGPDQLKIFQEYKDNMEKEQKDFLNDQAKAEMDRNSAQSEASAKYHQDVLRAEEDFNRDELQRLEDLNDKIAGIKADEQKQEVSITKDYRSRITDLKKKAEDDEAERLAKHQKEMQRMAEDHQHNLEEAAARLDAIAIVNEMSNYGKNKRRAEEDFNDNEALQRNNLNQQLRTEEIHYKESLKQLRQNNVDKIKELKDNFKREKDQRKADFDNKLADMKAQHAVEMAKIQQDFIDKMNLRNSQHNDEMAQLKQQATDAIALSLGIQKAGQDASLVELKAFWDSVKAQFATQGGGTNVTQPHEQQHPDTGGFAVGLSDVPRDGLYKLHRKERVLDAVTAANSRSMLGRPASRVNNSNNKQVSISMPISMSGITDGKSVVEVGVPAIEKAVIKVLKEALA